MYVFFLSCLQKILIECQDGRDAVGFIFFTRPIFSGKFFLLVAVGFCQCCNPVTVGKRSVHFYEGNPINLHYPL